MEVQCTTFSQLLSAKGRVDKGDSSLLADKLSGVMLVGRNSCPMINDILADMQVELVMATEDDNNRAPWGVKSAR